MLKDIFGRRGDDAGKSAGLSAKIAELLGSIRSSTKARHTVLEPLIIGETAILPLAKFRLSVGESGPCGSGGKPDSEACAGAGGGGMATACAFLIIRGDEARVVGFDALEETLSDFLEGDTFNSAVERILGKSLKKEDPR